MQNLLIKSIALILTLLLSITMLVLTPTIVYAAQFNLTDYCTDIPYSVSVKEGIIHIQSENINEELIIDTPVTACSVYSGLFTFLTYTEYKGDNVAACYCFDINTKKITSVSTRLPIYTDETRFAVDNEGKFYLIERGNNCVVNCFYNGNVIYSVDINSHIYQLMCIDGTHITAITAEGVYIIDENFAVYISDAVPVTPCTYTGKGYIADAQGVEFTYESGGIFVIPEPTASSEYTEPNNQQQTTDISISNEHFYVTFGLTVAKLRNSLGYTKEELIVYKIDGSLYNQGKVGTGMKAVLAGKEYIIIVLGELTGEGNINSKDLKLMMKFLTGEEKPNSSQKLSADINCDGIIDTKDLLSLSKLY